MTEMYYTYRCAAGESFDSIAMDIYGDERYAADILAVNPKLCEKLVFDGGEEITIPIIDVPQDQNADETALTAPWKE